MNNQNVNLNLRKKMIYKVGSNDPFVKKIQEALGLKQDGIFGQTTAKALIAFQRENNLVADGVAGKETIEALGILDSDDSRNFYTVRGLVIEKHFLPKIEYVEGFDNKVFDYLFLHHTAGWDNPYNVIDGWAKDTNGRIATEFVIGGQNIKNNTDEYDGRVVQAFPEGSYAYHLGKVGSQTMHKNSVAVELCNFGYIQNNKTYSGTIVHKDQIVTLDKEFRGFKDWHKYSKRQIENLRKLILYIADRNNIDVRKGIVEVLKAEGIEKAFSFNPDAYNGKIKGMWLHCNVRQDKFDMAPQPEFVNMLLNL